MINIRKLTPTDAKSFFTCLKTIDGETEYMMFEPGERVWNEDFIKGKIRNKSNLLLGAIEEEEVVGFLSAERGMVRRTQHSAYVVIGIRKVYCHQGIGTQLFTQLDKWARENKLKRLELTVETPNLSAINLYLPCTFMFDYLTKLHYSQTTYE